MVSISDDLSRPLFPPGEIHWGLVLPQGWKGEFADSTKNPSSVVLAWARRCEELGFDSAWLFDHFFPYPKRDASTVLELWTTLSAVSQVTERIIIGTLVSCSGYRHPTITTKMASTLVYLTNGRFCLGLGAGWDADEYDRLAIPYPPPRTRSDILLRAAELSRADPISRLAPLLVGGDGRQRTLKTAALHADLTNWQVGPAEFRQKSRMLAEWCDRQGTDYTGIRRTHATNFKLFEDRRSFRAWMQSEERGMSAADVECYIRSRGALYGTEAEVSVMVADFIGAGCTGFMLYCNDAPNQDVLAQAISLRSRSV